MAILWLGEERCHDRQLVGGKAAQLSQLAAIYTVPPGFCLTATMLAQVTNDQGRPSAALSEALTAAYLSLAARTGQTQPHVAVRSSAIDEDGEQSSFAGQHETCLNVVGIDGVLAAVDRCWASAHSARALAYRQQHGRSVETVQLAILVQQMAPADTAAVLFSANPVTGARDEVVITASWGLGESIVGGTVTPDTFVVSKTSQAVATRQIADKRRMTVAQAVGTREVEVPRLLRLQPCLTEAQVLEMARLGQALESHLGRPVDVECAYSAGRLILLQCRPITTLSANRARSTADQVA